VNTRISKNLQDLSFLEVAQGVHRKFESLGVIKLRRNNEHNSLEEELFSFSRSSG
jgi:hypothetical protein